MDGGILPFLLGRRELAAVRFGVSEASRSVVDCKTWCRDVVARYGEVGTVRFELRRIRSVDLA